MTEVLPEGHLQARGEHRVYLVTKTKLTSFEAADALARAAGVNAGDVAMAGLKDRQGVTKQYMSLHRGKDVRIDDRDLKISSAGFLDEPLTSADSIGNRFELVVRDLLPSELVHLRKAIDPVRQFGLPNYFDEQRFGNLRHGQGWIALDLIRGNTSDALKRLLCSTSPFDDPDRARLKQVLWRKWGDWQTCREVAGRLGKHHSVFEHLKRDPDDVAGAFGRVSGRERLIHLYAFQSHLWNRAVARWLDTRFGPQDRFGLRAREGKLVFARGAMPVEEGWDGFFPLPGHRLEEVEHASQRELLAWALEQHHLTPEAFVIDDVPGFAFKHEPRPIAVVPEDLRVRPAEPDPEHPGRHLVKLAFQLPRGAYASLVLRRLLGAHDRNEPFDRDGSGGRRRGGRRRGEGRGGGGGFRGARRGGGRRRRHDDRWDDRPEGRRDDRRDGRWEGRREERRDDRGGPRYEDRRDDRRPQRRDGWRDDRRDDRREDRDGGFRNRDGGFRGGRGGPRRRRRHDDDRRDGGRSWRAPDDQGDRGERGFDRRDDDRGGWSDRPRRGRGGGRRRRGGGGWRRADDASWRDRASDERRRTDDDGRERRDRRDRPWGGRPETGRPGRPTQDGSPDARIGDRDDRYGDDGFRGGTRRRRRGLGRRRGESTMFRRRRGGRGGPRGESR